MLLMIKNVYFLPSRFYNQDAVKNSIKLEKTTQQSYLTTVHLSEFVDEFLLDFHHPISAPDIGM
jgi:hypothetical protein